MLSVEEIIPGWVHVLIGEKFFKSCLVHESHNKNEENGFCLDCGVALCVHCLPCHTTHSLLRIWRYVKEDVLRLKDAQELIDCSSIKPYITNGAKVLFIKQRPLPIRRRMMIGGCLECQRNLQHPYLFCSLFCKVSYNMSNSRKRALTPNSVLETLANSPLTTLWGSKTSTIWTNRRIVCTKRRRSCTRIVSPATTTKNRRKNNVPRRSPLS